MKHTNLTIALALLSVPSLAFANAQDVGQTARAGQEAPERLQQATPMYASVSDLIGKDVWSKADVSDDNDRDDMADIRDFVVDRSTGKVTGVILSSGGIGSIGDTLRQVEFSSLHFKQDDDGKRTVWMDLTEDEFSKIAKIEEDSLKPYKCDTIAASFRDKQARAREAGSDDVTKKAREAQLRSSGAMLASEVDDLNVRAAVGSTNKDGEAVAGSEIGSIDEAWIDLSTGEIAYYTFEFEDRMLVFPRSTISAQVDREGESVHFVAPATNAILSSAPAMDEEKKMTLKNMDFRAQVDRFFASRNGEVREGADRAREHKGE
ncbi:MAG: hypothetical protein R3F49_07700 [Planctomycetota bacterium]